MSSDRYQRDLDRDALEWRAPEVAEFLRFRCLEWPPSHCASILEEIWQGILAPFFDQRPKDIKKQVILVERLANVDSIWARVGPLPINYIPISNVCSAIAFVLSMVIPPHPEDDWLSIAAIFVHFCRVASREDRPTSVHIVWQTANEHHFPSRKRPLILVDEVLLTAQATSAQPGVLANELARDYRSGSPSPNHVSVFRAQKIEELLDAVTGGSWRSWQIPTEPISPRTPATATSFEEGEADTLSSAPFPHCQCSALIPSFYAINQGRPVSALGFHFKSFHELLRQFKHGQVHYSALCEAVLPTCKACQYVMRQIGLDYTDVALSSTIPKEPLSSEYDLEDDVEEDYEVVDPPPSNALALYNKPQMPSPSPPHDSDSDSFPSRLANQPLTRSSNSYKPHYPHPPLPQQPEGGSESPLPISQRYPPSPSPSPPKSLESNIASALNNSMVKRTWMRPREEPMEVLAKDGKSIPKVMPPPPPAHGSGMVRPPSRQTQPRSQIASKSSAAKRHSNGTVSPPSSPSPPLHAPQQQQQAQGTIQYPWQAYPESSARQQALLYQYQLQLQQAQQQQQQQAAQQHQQMQQAQMRQQQRPHGMAMVLRPASTRPTQIQTPAYAQAATMAPQRQEQEQEHQQLSRSQTRTRYPAAPAPEPLQFRPPPPEHQAYFAHSFALVPTGPGARSQPVPPRPTTEPPVTVEPPMAIPPAPAASVSPVSTQGPVQLPFFSPHLDSEPPTRPPTAPPDVESAPPTRPPSTSPYVQPPPLPPKDRRLQYPSTFSLPDSPPYPSLPSPSQRPSRTQPVVYQHPRIQLAPDSASEATVSPNASPALARMKSRAKSVASRFLKPPTIEEPESEASSPSERDDDVATLATVSEAQSMYRRWGYSPNASIPDMDNSDDGWEEEPSTPRAVSFNMYGAPSMTSHSKGDDEEAEYDEWRNEGRKKFSKMFMVKGGSSSSSPSRHGHARSRSATITSSYANSPRTSSSEGQSIASSPPMSILRGRSGSGAIPPKMQLYQRITSPRSIPGHAIHHPSSEFSAEEDEEGQIITPLFSERFKSKFVFE